MSQPIYGYSAVNWGDGPAYPAYPDTLQLGYGNPVVGAPRQTSTDAYQFTITFTWASEHQYGATAVYFCTKSAEATDGFGLPGSHGCGNQTIPDSYSDPLG
jgi:hypothetical protein